MQAATVFLYILLAILPLFWMPFFSLEFELAKNLLFKQTMVISMLFITFFNIHRDKKIIIPKNKVIILILSFLGVNIAATLLSTSPTNSLWGSFQRQQGLTTITYYIVWLISVINLFKKEDFPVIAKTISITSIFTSIIGLIQTFFIDRIFSSFGHPNFFAQFILIALPFSLFIALTENKTWRNIMSVTIGLQIFSLILTGSRSGLIALGVLTLIILFQLSSTYKQKIFKQIALGLVTFSIASIALLNIFPSNPLSQNIPTLQRLILTQPTTNYATTTQSLSVRSIVWSAAIKAIADAPIIGNGPETTATTMQQYVTPELLKLESYHSLPDRIHSEPLDLLITTGFLGLITWYAIYFWTTFIAFKERKSKKHPLEASTIFNILAAGFIFNLLNFQTTTSYVFFFLLLGFILLFKKQTQTLKIPKHFRPILIVILLIGIGSQAYYNSQIAHADVLFKQWQKQTDQIELLETAHKITPQTHYSPFLINEYLNKNKIEKCLNLSTQEISKNPTYADLHALKGACHSQNNDTNLSNESFTKATNLFPYSPFTWRQWGISSFKSGNHLEAIEKLEHLLSFSPNYWKQDGELDNLSYREKLQHYAFFKHNPEFREIFLYLARAYFLNGQPDNALEKLQYAEKNIDTYSTYGVIYGSLGETEKAIDYFEEGLKLEPENKILKENILKLRQG